MNKIHVIGIGYRPFTKRAREILMNADTILASNRLFVVFQRREEYSLLKEKVMVINRVDETMEFIRNNFEKRAIVFLASGDPLFFGIGRKVLDEFGKNHVEILPDLSSIQVAFSVIKETWDDAFLMSLHGGPDPAKRRRLPYTIDEIPFLLLTHDKIAILTDRENNPSAIARRILNANQVASLKMFVCEKLGYPDEKTTSGAPDEIAGMNFTDPNVVIIKKDQESGVSSQELKNKTEIPEYRFGLTENKIVHSRGLLTKDEIRAVSVHKLMLPQKGILWDIGAGSGSVSIEAARLYPELTVYAIERDEEQLANIRENIMRFGMRNIEIISGNAPEVLRGLPSPDRVFIGGSRGRIKGIIDLIMEKMLRGVIVLNAITLETLGEATKVLGEDYGLEPEVSQISVSRSRILNGQMQMSALNPIFVIRGEKK